jgi:hypothetical protein
MSASEQSSADAPQTAPGGLSLERFATISAAIAEGDRPLPAVLAAHDLDEAVWQTATAHHTRLLAADAMDGDGTLSERYAAAFARAQDALRPVPELTPEAWAELCVAMAGPRGAEALAERGLGTGDQLRLARFWAARLGRERETARRYHEAFFKASRAQR